MNRPEFPTVFGVDYDGVIADTNVMKSEWIARHVGLSVPPWQCDRTNCVPLIGAEAYERMGSAVYEAEWSRTAPPVTGALEALDTLAGRGTVYVITARPRRRMAFAAAWLTEHGVGPRVGTLLSAAHGESKAQLCQRHGIEVMVDDDARHLTVMPAQSAIRILLRLGCPDEEPVAAGDLAVCRSWAQVLETLGFSPASHT